MAIKYLTIDEHREVVQRLVALAKSVNGFRDHSAGPEYTSLMACFMMHCVSASESLLTLHNRYGDEWFPTTTGYVIVRSLFEVDVNAHYITLDPAERSRRFIEFEHVIHKNTLEMVERYRASKNASWREGLQLMYNLEYAPKKAKIEAEYARVRALFENAKGTRQRTWSGKSLKQMTQEVGHLEAYEVFYADLSSFTHVDVMLANRFLRLKSDGPMWTMRADEFDVGSVFRYAATFLTCFFQLFGVQFGAWSDASVMACWNFPGSEGRVPNNPSL